MQLGMMNDPRLDPLDEARWAALHGFEFLDLTLEGPAASQQQIDVAGLRDVLSDGGLEVVGHTAWYLPFASPVRRVRQAAVDEVAEALGIFAELGARYVNVHMVRGISLFGPESEIQLNGESFAELARLAEPYDITIVVEHPPEAWAGIPEIQRVLAADDRLAFHLDVGHANVARLPLDDLLATFRGRLRHVHMSDNRGHSDDHMPIGAGRVSWSRAVRSLRKVGYDGTITLEVFADDRDYLLLSAKKLRLLWGEE
jgi:sugar phosphate isomerase/epimerase